MLRVLFVDDEARVLEALRASLRSQRRAWSMHFALGGHEALALLEVQRFEVIVSDLRRRERTPDAWRDEHSRCCCFYGRTWGDGCLPAEQAEATLRRRPRLESAVAACASARLASFAFLWLDRS